MARSLSARKKSNMVTQYYKRQLDLLRELGSEFAEKHPALAPMLAGPGADPDVERLLEGAAFLSGAVQERLEDDFPEIIHGLTQLLFPHYLRPLPSATIIQFYPKPWLKEPIKINKGVELSSVKKDGVSFVFTTCDEIEVLPLSMENVVVEGRDIRLKFKLDGMNLSELKSDTLKIYLSSDYDNAVQQLSVLSQYISQINLVAGDAHCVRPGGQGIRILPDDDVSLFSCPDNTMQVFQKIQEYFLIPQKFMFIELTGLNWLVQFTDLSSFDVILKLKKPVPGFSINISDLSLFCVPAVNIFQHYAESIFMDHHLHEYHVRPAGGKGYEVYSVDQVTGHAHGMGKSREYKPFSSFNSNNKNPLYSLRQRKSNISNNNELFLSVAYPEVNNDASEQETLALKIMCTNGSAADKLQAGDICRPTDSSPVLCDFNNILTPTRAMSSPIGDNLLWRMLSHLHINQQSLAIRDNLVELLKLYIFTNCQDSNDALANTRRAESIYCLKLEPASYLRQGAVWRGNNIHIVLDAEGFTNQGDMYLFCNIIKRLLSSYTGINSFTQLQVTTRDNSFSCKWKPQVGSQCTI